MRVKDKAASELPLHAANWATEFDASPNRENASRDEALREHVAI